MRHEWKSTRPQAFIHKLTTHQLVSTIIAEPKDHVAVQEEEGEGDKRAPQLHSLYAHNPDNRQETSQGSGLANWKGK